MRSGSSPIACAAQRPQPCKRQSPRQDRSSGQVKLEGADRRWERSPEVERHAKNNVPGRPPLLALASNQAIGLPDENKSGRTRGAKTTRGPGSTEMPESPIRGSKPAKGRKPRSAAGRRQWKEGESIVRQGRECPIWRSGTPRRKTRVGAWSNRTARTKRWCLIWLDSSRARRDRFHRSTPARRDRRRWESRLLDGLKRHRTTHPKRPPVRAAPLGSCYSENPQGRTNAEAGSVCRPAACGQ